MKTLVLDIWEADNIEFEVEITNKFAAAITRKFKAFCKEYDYDWEECEEDPDALEEFFESVTLEEISEKDAKKVFDAVSEEVTRSFRENWNDPANPDGWAEAFANTEWGYRPLRIEDEESEG